MPKEESSPKKASEKKKKEHAIPVQVKKVFDGFVEPMSTLDAVIAKLESDLGVKKPV